MDAIERLESPMAFGATFPDLTPWRRWITLLRGIYGLPFEDGDAEIWTEHARARARPGEGFRRVLVITGRQSGKSSIATSVAVHEALSAEHPLTGEVFVPLIAQDERCAKRVAFNYSVGLVENSPLYANRLLTAPRVNTLTFDNGAVLQTLPCQAASLRGYRCAAVILDEICFWPDGVFEETLEAALPTLASTNGRLIAISSPGAASGLAYELAEENPREDWLVWRGDTVAMNPTVDPEFLARLEAHDPTTYRREILGEFGSTEATLLDGAQVLAACREDANHLAPESGRTYEAFVDVSGGRVDRAALAIAHREGNRAVVDALHAWSPPFSPTDFVQGCLPLLQRYRVRRVVGDYFGAEMQADLWRQAGIEYKRSSLTRGQLHISMVPIFAGGLVELPNDRLLIREYRALQRRTTRAGKELADHPSGGTDDLCNAVSGAVVGVLRWRPDPWESWHQILRAEEAAHVALPA